MHLYQIPIINYHKIDPEHDIGITSRHPEAFLKDMQIIQSLEYTPITFKDIYNNPRLPEKPIIITFDDGYESIYKNAFPVMSEFRFKGVIFIPCNHIGKYNDWDVQFGNKKYKHLKKKQLSDLLSHGFEIGSHAMTHRLLTGMPDKKLIMEMKESKELLQELLNEEIISIGYPFGRFNNRTLQFANQAGYKFGVASIYFHTVPESLAHLALWRSSIYRFDSEKAFRKKLTRNGKSLISLRDWSIQKGGIATACYQYVRDLSKNEHTE